MSSKEELRDKVIIPARKIIRDDSKVKKFYFFPSLLSIIFLTGLLAYQTIYTYVIIWWNEDIILEKILHLLESRYLMEFIIILAIFMVLYFFLVPIFEIWLIKYLDFKNKWDPIGWTDAIWEWLTKFLPYFEYDNLFSEFKLISILNFYLFTIRFVGLDYIKITTIVYIIIFILWMVLNILFIYSKYAIILNKKLMFNAIWESSKLVILNLKKTIRLYFLIFIFNLRVIFNVLIFLLFPILIVWTIWYIWSKFIMIITTSILIGIFIILILLIAYLTSTLDVFKTSLWYYAYIDARKKIEDEEDDDK